MPSGDAPETGDRKMEWIYGAGFWNSGACVTHGYGQIVAHRHRYTKLVYIYFSSPTC